jgi:hypothetical protein
VHNLGTAASVIGVGLAGLFFVLQESKVALPVPLLGFFGEASLLCIVYVVVSFLLNPVRCISERNAKMGFVLAVVIGAVAGAIIAGGSWLLWRGSPGSFWHQPRVQWHFGGFLAMGGYRDGPGESIALRISGFQAQGTNNSDEPITSISGHLRSNLTNETLPLYMIVNGVPVPPGETNGVPPRATFGVVVPFGPDSFTSHGMLNEETFLRRFGDFTVVIELDGRREEHRFSTERILRLISDWKRGVYGSDKPGVTKKDH